MRPTSSDSQNSDNISSSAHETLLDDDQIRTHEAVGVEAITAAEEEGNPRLYDAGSEGTLSLVSGTIDDNLRLFRTGAATMVVGSGLTVAFLVYRRGLHGFGSASQVPASYFKRRKRVRVRIAKVVAAALPNPVVPAEGYGGRISEDKARAAEQTEEGPLGGHARHRPGADVLLHAEHITIVRRLLRLPPRSLFPGALHDPAPFTLRLCGVSAEVEGVELAQKELVHPLIGKYCDAELLFREQRFVACPSGGRGTGFGIAGSGQTSWPVAVCHLHRRRGTFWGDLIQSRLDPKAGFGEHLLSKGLARLREELCWATDDTPSTTATSSASSASRAVASKAASERLPGLQRLIEDRERFASAEEDAERARRGLWAALYESGEKDGAKDAGNKKIRTTRMGWMFRALAKLFGRR